MAKCGGSRGDGGSVEKNSSGGTDTSTGIFWNWDIGSVAVGDGDRCGCIGAGGCCGLVCCDHGYGGGGGGDVSGCVGEAGPGAIDGVSDGGVGGEVTTATTSQDNSVLSGPAVSNI